MKLIVGLGNPGNRYEQTRHNIGFDVVSRFAQNFGLSEPSKLQHKCLISSSTYSSKGHSFKLILGKPQNFMNRSGEVLSSLMAYYKINIKDVIVVHDELALPFGLIRCKKSGGHGGHNGLRDIIKHCGDQFLRLRFGVGPTPQGWDTAKYVLGSWSKDEQSSLDDLIDYSARILDFILSDGIDSAMNRFNSGADINL